MEREYSKLFSESEKVILDKMFLTGNKDGFIDLLGKLLVKAEMNRNVKIYDIQVGIYNYYIECVDLLLAQYDYLALYLERDEFEILVTEDFLNMNHLTETIMFIAGKLLFLISKLPKNISSNLVEKVVYFAWKNVDEGKNLADIADSLYVNKTYLSHLFKQEMGTTFAKYHSEIRMLRSRVVLKHVDTVYECSYGLGYEDCEYFSKKFKDYFGLKPTEYKLMHRTQAFRHRNHDDDL